MADIDEELARLSKRLERDLKTLNVKIHPLKGSTEPLTLEGGEDPLTQVVKKVNEIVDYINNQK